MLAWDALAGVGRLMKEFYIDLPLATIRSNRDYRRFMKWTESECSQCEHTNLMHLEFFPYPKKPAQVDCITCGCSARSDAKLDWL